MSELIATQIPKPRGALVFERGNEILWRCILKDGSVKTYGRNGQEQYGVDGIPDRIVGVQCKLKGERKKLTEDEDTKEVAKAPEFKPSLSEHIIVTIPLPSHCEAVVAATHSMDGS